MRKSTRGTKEGFCSGREGVAVRFRRRKRESTGRDLRGIGIVDLQKRNCMCGQVGREQMGLFIKLLENELVHALMETGAWFSFCYNNAFLDYCLLLRRDCKRFFSLPWSSTP